MLKDFKKHPTEIKDYSGSRLKESVAKLNQIVRNQFNFKDRKFFWISRIIESNRTVDSWKSLREIPLLFWNLWIGRIWFHLSGFIIKSCIYTFSFDFLFLCANCSLRVTEYLPSYSISYTGHVETLKIEVVYTDLYTCIYRPFASK